MKANKITFPHITADNGTESKNLENTSVNISCAIAVILIIVSAVLFFVKFGSILSVPNSLQSVSYTHLDVYKRQE